MQPKQPVIPLYYAQLIIRFTHNLLSEAEQEALDQWIEASDENMEMFEMLTDDVAENVFSADELIIETEDLLDTWMAAGLVTREIQGIISDDEKRALQNWLAESEDHRRVYALLQDKANLQKIVRLMKGLREGEGKAGMN